MNIIMNVSRYHVSNFKLFTYFWEIEINNYENCLPFSFPFSFLLSLSVSLDFHYCHDVKQKLKFTMEHQTNINDIIVILGCRWKVVRPNIHKKCFVRHVCVYGERVKNMLGSYYEMSLWLLVLRLSWRGQRFEFLMKILWISLAPCLWFSNNNSARKECVWKGAKDWKMECDTYWFFKKKNHTKHFRYWVVK